MNTQFTKCDLKNGMVVEFEDNKLFLVIDNILIGHNCWADLNDYNDDLTGCGRCPDIVKVYDVCNVPRYIDDFFSNLGEVIWKRTKKKEISLEEAIAVLKTYYGCDDIEILCK